jgi:acyl-CoA reductase-like NAD-dependent aldehyde dehydrogenase
MLLSSLLICETIYIWEDIYDKFVEKAVEVARNKKIGDPFD